MGVAFGRGNSADGRRNNKKKRHDLLSKSVEDAVSSGDLVLTKASLCGPRDPIEKISRRTDWPLLVVEEEPSRLLGILTPFDLLERPRESAHSSFPSCTWERNPIRQLNCRSSSPRITPQLYRRAG